MKRRSFNIMGNFNGLAQFYLKREKRKKNFFLLTSMKINDSFRLVILCKPERRTKSGGIKGPGIDSRVVGLRNKGIRDR